MHHLRRKRRRYYFHLTIPPDLRRFYLNEETGESLSYIEKSTKTDSPSQAQIERDKLLGQYKSEFAKLRQSPDREATPEDLRAMVEHATLGEYEKLKTQADKSEALLQAQVAAESYGVFTGLTIGADQPTNEKRELLLRVGLTPSERNNVVAHTALGTAKRRALGHIERRTQPTPPKAQHARLADVRDTFIAETDLEARQARTYRREIDRLVAWCGLNGIEPDASMGRRVAGQYVSHIMVTPLENDKRGLPPTFKSASNRVSALSSLWRWLIAKGHADENIWTGHFVGKRKDSKAAKRHSSKPRHYTDDEVAKLLAGDTSSLRKYSQTVSDFLRLSLLHGMRESEIAWLRVKYVEDGMLRLRNTKTQDRDVPIHKEAKAIFRRLRKGKGPNDFLFPELPDAPEDDTHEKAKPVSKAFTRFRRSVGVEEQSEMQRNSNVTFHSARRWFVHKARTAANKGMSGFSRATIADVVGHKKGDDDLGITEHYAGTSTLAEMRACIESVSVSEFEPQAQQRQQRKKSKP